MVSNSSSSSDAIAESRLGKFISHYFFLLHTYIVGGMLICVFEAIEQNPKPGVSKILNPFFNGPHIAFFWSSFIIMGISLHLIARSKSALVRRLSYLALLATMVWGILTIIVL